MLGLGSCVNKNQYTIAAISDLTISEMESLIEWDEHSNCTASVDTVNYVSGIGSLELIRDNTNIKEFSSTYDYTVDLSKYNNLNYYINIINKDGLDYISLILYTSASKTDSSSFVNILSSSSITNGWNTITTTLSSYSQSGIATLADVKAIKFEVTML
jgi:hypothetical protein